VLPLTVPYFEFDATLDDAVKALRATGKSAIVADDGHQSWLIKADTIKKAREDGRQRLIEVDSRDRIPIGRPDPGLDPNSANQLGGATPVDVDKILEWDLASYTYSAVPVSDSEAILVARNDSDGEALNTPAAL
jgi:hypothetical protein